MVLKSPERNPKANNGSYGRTKTAHRDVYISRERNQYPQGVYIKTKTPPRSRSQSRASHRHSTRGKRYYSDRPEGISSARVRGSAHVQRTRVRTSSRGRSQENQRRSNTPLSRLRTSSRSRSQEVQRRSNTPVSRGRSQIQRRSRTPSKSPRRERVHTYTTTRTDKSQGKERSVKHIHSRSPRRQTSKMRVKSIERPKLTYTRSNESRPISPEIEVTRGRTKSPRPTKLNNKHDGRQGTSPYPARSKSTEKRTTTISVKSNKRRGKSPGAPPSVIDTTTQGFSSKRIYGGKQEYVVSNKNKTVVLEFLMNKQSRGNIFEESEGRDPSDEIPNDYERAIKQRKSNPAMAQNRVNKKSHPKHDLQGKYIKIGNMDEIEGIGFESFDMDVKNLGNKDGDTNWLDLNKKGEGLKEYLLKSVECRAYTCTGDATVNSKVNYSKEFTTNSIRQNQEGKSSPVVEVSGESAVKDKNTTKEKYLTPEREKDITPQETVVQEKNIVQETISIKQTNPSQESNRLKTHALSIFETWIKTSNNDLSKPKRFDCSKNVNCASPIHAEDVNNVESKQNGQHAETVSILEESKATQRPTALYVAIGSKNWKGAIARVLEAPEEASTWVDVDATSAESTLVRFLPLHLACLSSKDIPLLLLTLLVQAHPYGVKMEAMGKLPIHMACEAQADHRIVFLLLNSWPESLYMKDDQEFTPIETVSLTDPCKERTSIIKVLTKRMENSVVTRPTSLYAAIDTQNWNYAMRRLVEMPQEATTWVSFNKKKVEVRFLPLHVACLLEAPMLLIADLIQAYPGAVKKKTLQGKLPIHIACAAHTDPRVIEMLLESWPEGLYVKDSEGNTPVEVTTMVELDPDRSKILDVLRRNYQKRKLNISFAPTQLYSLIGSKDWNTAVRRVLEAPNEASTWIGSCNKKIEAKLLPLHLSCSVRSPLLLTAVLIQSYPDALKLKDGKGKIPLHLACEKKADHRVVSLLLHAYPESFFAEDTRGNTPIQSALLTAPSPERTKILETLTAFEENNKDLKFTSNTTQAIDSIVNFNSASKKGEEKNKNNVSTKQRILKMNNQIDASRFKKKRQSFFRRGRKGNETSLWEDDEEMFASS